MSVRGRRIPVRERPLLGSLVLSIGMLVAGTSLFSQAPPVPGASHAAARSEPVSKEVNPEPDAPVKPPPSPSAFPADPGAATVTSSDTDASSVPPGPPDPGNPASIASPEPPTGASSSPVSSAPEPAAAAASPSASPAAAPASPASADASASPETAASPETVASPDTGASPEAEASPGPAPGEPAADTGEAQPPKKILPFLKLPDLTTSWKGAGAIQRDAEKSPFKLRSSTAIVTEDTKDEAEEAPPPAEAAIRKQLMDLPFTSIILGQRLKAIRLGGARLALGDTFKFVQEQVQVNTNEPESGPFKVTKIDADSVEIEHENLSSPVRLNYQRKVIERKGAHKPVAPGPAAGATPPRGSPEPSPSPQGSL